MDIRGFVTRPRSTALFVCALSFLTLAVTSSTASAEAVSDGKKAQVLRVLAAHNRSTWDGLKTWSGTFQYQERELFYDQRADDFVRLAAPELSSYPPEFTKDVSGHVAFALDLTQDRLFTRLEATKADIRDLTTKPTPLGIDVPPFSQTSIVTGEAYLRFEPTVRYPIPQGDPKRMAFSDHPDKAAVQHWGTVVDPREFLGYGRPMWQNLEMMADALGDNGRLESDEGRIQLSKTVKEGVEEYHVLFQGRFGPDHGLAQHMVFRADADYNITLLMMSNREGGIRQQLRWQYTPQDGLFLPSFVEYKEFSPSTKGRRIKFQRTLRLSDSRVNKPIHAVTFSLRNLGLQNEDLLLNKQTGQRSVYRGGTLTPIASD